MAEALTNCIAFSTRFFSMALVAFILIIILVAIIRWQASAQKSRYYKELKEKEMQAKQKQIELTTATIARMKQESIDRKSMMRDNVQMFQTLRAITENMDNRGINNGPATVAGDTTVSGIPGPNTTVSGIPGSMERRAVTRLIPMTQRNGQTLIPYKGQLYTPAQFTAQFGSATI